ncbi:MAG: hypothetical protein QXJ81_03495 [Metallosphaera sp.]
MRYDSMVEEDKELSQPQTYSLRRRVMRVCSPQLFLFMALKEEEPK